MYSKSGTGFVLVITSATHKVNTGRKGINGQELILDVAFNPLDHALGYADVFQLPISLGHSPIAQKHLGSPGFGPLRRPPHSDEPSSTDIYAVGGVYKYSFTDDIAAEISLGDRIYFKKRILNNKHNLMGTLKGEDGKPAKYLYKVPYEAIFCAVRHGKIIPIGGHVLLKPIYEDWTDIYRKTYYEYAAANGQRVERPKKDWLQLKAEPEADNMRGIVAYVGTPLKGEVCDIEVGETVLFRKQPAKIEFKEIEGENYIVLGQDQILASLSGNVKLG